MPGPTARLTVIHNVSVNSIDPTVTLDMPTDLMAEGGPVLDAAGGLLGMAIIGADGEAAVMTYASIARMLFSGTRADQRSGAAGWGSRCSRSRCPKRCAMRSARRPAGRRVSLAPGGPAELAGLLPGASDCRWMANSISGTHALRAFLGPEQVLDVRSMSGCCATARWKRASSRSRRSLTAEQTV